MNSEHLDDLWIQGYLVHDSEHLAGLILTQILLEGELLENIAQKLLYYNDSSLVSRMYHHFINHLIPQEAYNDSMNRYIISGG
jgi:hypothetical protein